MPIRLRNGIYQIDVVTASGARIRRSAGTSNKVEAQELHDKLKHEMWRVERMGDKPKRSWDEAAVRWINEMAHKKSINDDISKIRLLTKFRGMLLTDITRDFVMSVVNGMRCKNATKNRYISLIRAILRKCEREWEWIDKAPSFTCFKEPVGRTRWITPEQAKILFSALPEADASAVILSLCTGLRKGNVFGKNGMVWAQLDVSRCVYWVAPEQAKSGAAIGVPLNDTAMSIIMSQKGKHPKYILTKRGRPMLSINRRTWANALSKAGITDFRWHDLRHTWASWMVQSRVPLYDIKELGGWKSLSMVQRYAHLAPEHLMMHTKHVDMIDVTNLSHTKNALAENLEGSEA